MIFLVNVEPNLTTIYTAGLYLIYIYIDYVLKADYLFCIGGVEVQSTWVNVL